LTGGGDTLLAIDIGGTKTTLAVAKLSAGGSHPYLAIDRLPTPSTAAAALVALLAAGRRLLGDDQAAGIGVSFGGHVHHAPRCRLMSRHVPGWEAVDLVEHLTRGFGGKTLIANDADAASRGEHACLPVDQQAMTLAYLTVSTGIGAAMIIDGRPHLGRYGLAGELGHLPISLDGPSCSCGSVGHLEALASGPAIARAAVAALDAEPQRRTVLHAARATQGFLTAVDVDRAARHGDELAARLLGEAGALVGHAVTVMTLVLDPDLVIVGGGVAQAGPAFWQPLRQAAQAGALRTPDVRRSGLGATGALRGALELARAAAHIGHQGDSGAHLTRCEASSPTQSPPGTHS